MRRASRWGGIVAVVLGVWLSGVARGDANYEIREIYEIEIIQSLDELLANFDSSSLDFLPILVPDPDYLQAFEGGRMVVDFDSPAFSQEFINGLSAKGIEDRGVMTYPVTIRLHERSHDFIIEADDGTVLAQVKRPKDYDCFWYARMLLEGKTVTRRELLSLHAIHDPSRIIGWYTLVTPDGAKALSEIEAAERLLLESLVPLSMPMRTMSGGGSPTSLCFTAIQAGVPASNAVQVTIGYPSSLYSVPLDIVGCSDLMDWDWSVLVSTNAASATDRFDYVISPASTNSQFLSCYRTDIPAGDTDGDGVPDGEEMFLDETDKDDADDPANIKGTVTYDTNHGGGGQTGLIHVVAVTSLGNWSTNISDALSSTGSYHIIKIPHDTYYVKAWRDSDGNGSVGTYEATGSYSAAAMVVSNQWTGINFTMHDPDGDADLMGDWWEQDYFQNIFRDPGDDFDGDKLSNLYEYYLGSNPAEGTPADTDGDGMYNDWERHNELDPDDPSDVDEDPDHDGFSNLEEFVNNNSVSGTDPNDVTSHPTGAIYVDDASGNDSTGDGSYTNALKSISAGISAASSGNRIVVQPGTYTGAVNRAMSFGGKNLFVIGPYGAGQTIVDCEEQAFCFQATSTETNLAFQGLTIRNGKTTSSGAAIRSLSVALRIESCVFENNTSTEMDGGAIYSSGSFAAIRNSRFVGNGASGDGGAVHLTIEQDVLEPLIEHCTFSRNSAGLYGGSLYLNSGIQVASIRNSSFCESESLIGGGVYMSGSGARTVDNCVISDNASYSCGGIGMYSYDVVRNCVLWGNVPDSIEGLSANVEYCCIENWPYGGIGNITNAPLFADDEHRLSYLSPCRNAGTNQSWMSSGTDLFGQDRILQGRVDMGLHELNLCLVSAGNGGAQSPYGSWPTAAATIQDAIDASTGFDSVVLVTNGVYNTGATVAGGALPARVALTNAVLVTSVNGAAETIIAGAGPRGASAVRCAYVSSNACLSGFTLTNGNTFASGWPLDTDGGGAWCEGGGRIENSIIVGCSAYDGGGIYGGSVMNSTVIGNTAAHYGGGLCDSYAEALVISENDALVGGGVAGVQKTSHCRGCLIVSNTATSSGGGFEVLVENCTIVDNASTNSPGGVLFCSAYNSIIYSNWPTNWSGTGDTFDHCCTTPCPSGFWNLTDAPGFVDLPSGDYHLAPNSVCVNSGSYSPWMFDTVDLDGVYRVIGENVDMGCYESAVTSCTYGIELMFVIDNSPSMEDWTTPPSPGLANAKYEAGSCLDALRAFDRSGAVNFNAAAYLMVGLTDLPDEGSKDIVKQPIYALGTSSGSYIYNGLTRAYGEFATNSLPQKEQAIVLMTDARLADIANGYIETMPIGPRLHTIAVGSSSSWFPDFESWIAQRRNGTFHASPTGAGVLSIADANVIFSTDTDLVAGGGTHAVTVDPTIAELVFRVSWDYTNAPLSLGLEMPDQTEINAQSVDSFPDVSLATNSTSMAYILTTPTNGQWAMKVSGSGLGQRYRATAYGNSAISARFELPRIQYNQSNSIAITLRTSALATNAYVVATNAEDLVGLNVELFDDGVHNDAASNDGLYGGSFTNTTTGDRSWRLTAHVNGQLIGGDEFHRVTEESIYIADFTNQLVTVTNIVATDGTYSNRVSVSWSTNVADVGYYDVYRAENDRLADANLVGVVTNTVYCFDDTNAIPFQTYSYWVRAYKKGSLDGDFSNPDTGFVDPY